jgi:hypothetical protein
MIKIINYYVINVDINQIFSKKIILIIFSSMTINNLEINFVHLKQHNTHIFTEYFKIDENEKNL